MATALTSSRLHLITGDSLQNWESYEGCTESVIPQLQQMGFKGGALIGPLWRKALERREGPTLRGDFDRILSLPFKHLLSAHGNPLRDRAHAAAQSVVASTFG